VTKCAPPTSGYNAGMNSLLPFNVHLAEMLIFACAALLVLVARKPLYFE